MGLKSTQCWAESERILLSPTFRWCILRKSSIRTTCNLPLQVVKHLKQRRWWLCKVWAPSKIIIFDEAQTKQCWAESERNSIEPIMFWCGILRKSSIRTTCNLPLQVAKHRNQRRWWVYKVWVSWDRMPVQIFFHHLVFVAAQLRHVSAGINWTAHKPNKTWARELQRDGPGRIWAFDHLLPRLLQNAPGARGEGGFKWKSLCWTQTCPTPCWSKSNSASYR